MGAGGRGGRNELQWIVFWPQLRSGGSTWLGSIGRVSHQTVGFGTSVLGCAGSCERLTIYTCRAASRWQHVAGKAASGKSNLCPVGASCRDSQAQRDSRWSASKCLACRSYAVLLFCETQNTPI